MVKNEADFADLEHQWFHDGITDTAYLGACFQIEALLRREIELRRHWLNSILRAEGIPDDMVRRVTGHESEEMTDHYTTYVRDELEPIAQIQARIF